MGRLTDTQFAELEKRLIAAEIELADSYARFPNTNKHPAIELIEFHALEYLRRLIDDAKSDRADLAEALKALEHILAMPRIKLHGNHFGEWSERATVIKAANIVLAKHQPKGDETDG